MNESVNGTKTNNGYGLVSIIMPNYNSQKYVEKTIKSVLAQTYQNWELLFVDDCSTDKSLEIARSFNDDRIKIFQNEENSGAAISRNRAISEAKGRWIAFLDSDDLWQEDKLLKHVAFMAENDVAFSCTPYSVINDDGDEISVFSPKEDKYTYKDILKHSYIGCLTVIYDSDKVGKVYMPDNAVKREDLACWLQILKTGTDVVCFHENLSTYVVHQNSVSSNKLKMAKYQWRVYRKVEKLSLLKSLYYLAHWAVLGFFKYR